MTTPIPMRLPCPSCGALHVDEGEFATRPHHTHACQSCGMVWRPALVATVGVRYLPGFRDPVAMYWVPMLNMDRIWDWTLAVPDIVSRYPEFAAAAYQAGGWWARDYTGGRR